MRTVAPRIRAAAIAVVGTLVLTLLAGLGPFGSSAAAETPWWEPTARPSPDSGIGVTGEPFRGVDAAGEVRGFADLHNHLMSNEGFGGRLICGAPFAPEGIAAALVDCPEHYPNGAGALFENLTSDPDWQHDPVGWPTFADWPSSTTTSHQQNYYAWIERTWRSGLRVMVTDLVTNAQICTVYPAKDRSCDEMESIRLQAAKTYEMQDYIDGVYGGPGRGFFRIVTDPAQAERVIADGKLAVVLGVETSEPFGCKQVLDVPQCSRADIDRGLDELHALGVRSMFLCHKFDNGLCGVRFDPGTTGTIINVGQFLGTGTFWATEPCRGPQEDNPISTAPVPEAGQLLPAGVPLPVYDPAARCNTRGLTALGEHAVRGMIERNMMLEIDHMSVKAAGRALDMLEAANYPGVISSHSWMDLDWSRRVYQLGGVIAEYVANSTAFIDAAGRTNALREEFDRGLGMGTDFNGVGAHPAPRGADAPDAVSYPFPSVDGGATIDRQVTGERTWDVNTDGGAHYGLVPDWIEDVRRQGGTDAVADLFRGAASYLDTWRATAAYQPPADLTDGARATASSTERPLLPTFRAARAVDDDPRTRWASRWADDEWLTIDLGSEQTVGRVVTDWEAAHARAYRIEVSDDGRTWSTAWSTTDGAGGLQTAVFTPTEARYVRVHGDARATRYGYSLWEVRVHSE